MAKLTLYLQLNVKYQELGNGNFKVVSMSVDRTTQRPPQDPSGLVAKINVEIPDERLVPIQITARTEELDFSGEFKAVMDVLNKE